MENTETAYISDVHANLEGLDAVLADIVARGIKKIVFLGDLLGYGPNPKEVIDRFIQLKANKDIELVLMPGNHDEITYEQAKKLVKGLPLQSQLGMGEVAYDAMGKQLEILLTENPREYFAEDYVANLISRSNIRFPAKVSEQIKQELLAIIETADRNTSWKSEAKKKASSDIAKYCDSQLVSNMLSSLPLALKMNRELLGNIEAHENAVEILKFIESLVNSQSYRIVDRIHCFHTPAWSDKVYPYLLDPEQAEIREENGLKPISDADTIEDAIRAAKRICKTEIYMGHGHDHIPNVYETPANGSRLVLFSAGTVGWPRIKTWNGEQCHDKASYVVRKDNNFEVVHVPYDWEETDRKTIKLGMPRNRIWVSMKEAV